MDRKITIEGTITLISPLHTTAQTQEQSIPGKAQVQRTAKLPIADYRFFNKPTEDDDPLGDGLEDTVSVAAPERVIQTRLPTLHGNNIRGRIRSHIVDRVLDHLIESGQQIDKPTYYQMLNGATVGGVADKTGPKSIAHYQSVCDDLVAGIFGIGTDWPSRLTTLSLIPVMPSTIDRGMVPERFAGMAVPTDDAWRLFFIQTLYRRDRLVDFAEARVESLFEGGEKAIVDWFAGLETVDGKPVAEKSAKEASAKSSKGIKNIMEHECVAPGVTFYTRFSLESGCTDAHAGALVYGLVAELEKNGLGGNSRYGYGRFNASFDVTLDGKRHIDAISSIDGNANVSPDLGAILDAAEQQSKATTADTLKRVLVKREAA